MKVCKKCGGPLHPVGVKRIVLVCAACDKARIKAWNEANREKVRARAAARREAHREEIREYNRARRATNPDAIRAVELAWREKNRDHIKEYRDSRRDIEAERAYMRSYYKQHEDEIKARARANYDSDKQRAYRQANAEAIHARAAAYRLRNADNYKRYRKEWDERNPGARTVHQRNREARKKGLIGELSPDIVPRMYARQRGLCACCRQPLGEDYHLDHIVPLCRGGTNTDDNVQLLRAQCNREKSRLDPIAFMQRRGFLL